MDEARVLELALQNCQKLERSINESIKMVRRLNIRYNSDWLVKNYKQYMCNVWGTTSTKTVDTQFQQQHQQQQHHQEQQKFQQQQEKQKQQSKLAQQKPIQQKCMQSREQQQQQQQLPQPTLTGQQLSEVKRKTRKCQNLAVSARSSHELCGSNRKINYKFIKIKRSMEALLLQIQRAIEIANRQRNFVHVNVLGRDSRTRICCH